MLSQLQFMNDHWQGKGEFEPNRFVRVVCAEIDQARADFEKGWSTFLAIKAPFLSGKSTIASQYLPAHFSLAFPGKDIFLVSYSMSLASVWEGKAKRLLGDGGKGKILPFGINSAIAGHGASLIVFDDIIRDMHEANNKVKRDVAWKGFEHILSKRFAPSIVIVIGCTWHTDDIFGRIKKEMKRKPGFPRFRELSFPAFDESYPQGTLLPEMYSEEWYKDKKCVLGPKTAEALMQCKPVKYE